jgi:hypothetical protein
LACSRLIGMGGGPTVDEGRSVMVDELASSLGAARLAA